MANNDLIQTVAEWFHDRKIEFDSEEFEALCVANYTAEYHLEAFDAAGELSELLDNYDWALKKGDLDAFFDSLEYLRVYASEDALVEDFCEAFDVDPHVARYLDEDQIVRDFLYGGGFQIGSFLCESC